MSESDERLAAGQRRGRIAVIAVHGVADQSRGSTAQALAELLAAQTPPGARYRSTAQTDLILPVPPLAPMKPLPSAPPSWRKKTEQSLRSDFLRKGRHAGPQAQGNATAGADADEEGVSSPAAFSPGAHLTDYLLMKAQQCQLGPDSYQARRMRLERQSAQAQADCDLYEMHWADLSRLEGSAPAIVTELFTVLFRLSTLGRDAVQTAAQFFKESRAWRLLDRLQTGLDWAYSRILALLFLQLIMAALVMVPLGMLSNHVGGAHMAAAGAAGVYVALRVLYRTRRAVLGAALGILLAALLWALPGPWVAALVWLAALARVYDAYLKMCEERFRMVRAVGWILWAAVLALTIGYAASAPTADFGMWIFGSLRAFEYVLLAIALWWMLGGLAFLAWMLVGQVASARGARTEDPLRKFLSRASVSTGRFALGLSLAFFFVLAMSAWAVLNRGIAAAVDKFTYEPLIFKHASVEFADLKPLPISADDFLHDRFTNTAETFSLSFFLLLALLLYLVIVLLPCVISELKWSHQKADRLGLWLTSGYRRLENVIRFIVGLAVVCVVLVSLLLAWSRFGWTPMPQLIVFQRFVAEQSAWLLEPLVLSAGAATVALTGAGRLLSRYAPWLRAPLDIALDIDNHFREFPRSAIPRARIFSRYAALLREVAAGDYERIVIVAHSQGTVLTAELLRYLKERAALAGPGDEVAELWKKLAGRIHLLTVGSPLRQLYATRFPVLYDWVIASQEGTMGPAREDIGVERWVNGYGTGDYIGRWLWSRPPAGPDRVLTQIDELPADAKGTPYQVPTEGLPNAPAWVAQKVAGCTRMDISLGAEAHTHYFDRDSATVAWLVDALIVT